MGNAKEIVLEPLSVVNQNSYSTTLSSLPGYAPDWLGRLVSDSDAESYLGLLNDAYMYAGPSEENELIRLQDVFYLFWKSVGRRERYVQEALRLHG